MRQHGGEARERGSNAAHVPGWAGQGDGRVGEREGHDGEVPGQAAHMTAWARARREGEGEGEGEVIQEGDG